MHSSSAACVFGDARFTSSTSRRFVKTGPRRNSKVFARWSKTLTPVTSEGRRSGVNCNREKEQSSERASAFASIVFPTPGKSSMIRCPSATRQSTTSRSVSSGACTTRRRFATIAATRSAGAGATAGSAKDLLHGVEDEGRDLLLACAFVRTFPIGGDEGDGVVRRVETDVAARDVVEDDRVDVLARELLPRTFETPVALVGGEADQHLAGAPVRAERLEDVGRGLELERPGRRVLRPLRGQGLRRLVVGDRRRHDDDVGLRAAGERLALEIGGGRRLDHVD